MRAAAPIVIVLICASTASAAKRFHESDGYFPAQTMPMSVYGVPVGEARTLTIRLPDRFKAQDYPLTLLWLSVDDIDVQKEARMFINDNGPHEVPASTLGEGKDGHVGHMRLDAGLLKPGVNELKFVFADNLGGSTGGFDIMDAMIVLPRPGGQVDDIPMIEREIYIDWPDHPKLAIYNSTLEPRLLRRSGKKDPTGWKPHDVRKGDGDGGWTYLPGELQFLSAPTGQIMPFGLAKMDNGELILTANLNDGHNRIVTSFSKDNGDTWTDWHLPRTAHGRPMGVVALGGGKVTMASGRRYFSSDYGRSFPVEEWIKVSKAANGQGFAREGHGMVDFDKDGNVSLIMELGHNLGPQGLKGYPRSPSVHYIRRSTDGGKTWTEQPAPEQWKWTSTHEGKTWPRGTNEGSLVRAKNGWIVAAMRTDMPAEFFPMHHDHWEGTAVSISKDDGKTWSPLSFIYMLGRMHAHLLRLPNDDLMMGYILRQDLRDDGSFASYNRGMEALISHDNGLTWDKSRKYLIDGWPFVDPQAGPTTLVCGHTCSVALDDGRVISAYGHYPSKGGVLIRWKPQ